MRIPEGGNSRNGKDKQNARIQIDQRKAAAERHRRETNKDGRRREHHSKQVNERVRALGHDIFLKE